CRIASTLRSLRSLRIFSSSSRLFASGCTFPFTTVACASRAVSAGRTRPGSSAATCASPPAAGRHQSFAASASSSCLDGRAEVNSRSPLAVKTGPLSPWVPCVRRRAGRAPVGSISHSAVVYFVLSSLTVATVVTSRRASGEIARPESRGREMYSSRSWNGVAILHVYHGRFPPAPVAAPAGARSAPLLFALARAVLVRVLVGALLEHRVVGLEVGLPVAVRCPIDPPSYPFLGLRPHHCQGDREREAGELPDTPRDLPGDALVQGGIDSPGEAELA